MTLSLRRGALALALLGGAALLGSPASANDFSEEGDFGGTYLYIGPGVAYAPPAIVYPAPVYPAPVYGPPVYAAPVYPGPVVAPPVLDYYPPDGAIAVGID
jgi:hypothetical protein